MALMEYYPQIKWVHVHAVQCSGLVFALRCGASLLGASWPRHAFARHGSYVVDTTLLATGLILFAILPSGVFANGWLAVKLTLVVVYVVLGVLAMRPKRSQRARFGFYLAALATFGFIYGIARMHNPLGWLSLQAN